MVMVELQINDNACGEKYMTVGRMSASETTGGVTTANLVPHQHALPDHQLTDSAAVPLSFVAPGGGAAGSRQRQHFGGNNNTPL